MKGSELFEQLAAIEHERWADWQKHLHENICKANPDGSLTIPAGAVKQYSWLIDTSYAELPEKEKEKDRPQVNRYWELVKPKGMTVTELGDLMTIRMALTMFIMDLNRTGLGNDETGKGICDGYIARSVRLIPLLGELEDTLMKQIPK